MDRLKTLIAEVHRRSLWQVLLIYIGAGWVVFEIVQTVTEGLGLPQWFPAFAALLLLIGLPVVLATAFVREGEPAGTVSDPTLIPVAEGGSAAARRRRVLTWRNAGLSFLAALAVWGVVATGWLLISERPPLSEDERVSIAVLPFKNLSPDPDDAYFADGIHEEIISQLGKIASLKVISSTSVKEYRDREANLRTIADELGVTHVLEGSVRRDGAHVRITIQLIAARDDAHLWAENYERELRGIFEVQADVAREVTGALRAVLTPEEIARIEARPTENEEAYQYYLRAGPTEGRLHIALLDTAVSIDPNFAAAWSALGVRRLNHIWFGGDDFTLQEAKQAIDRAVALDPDSPATQRALGLYYYWGLRDYDAALEHFFRVQRLEPSDAGILHLIGAIRRRQGRWDEAVSVWQQISALEPRAPARHYSLAGVLMFMRDYEQAERYFDRALALNPANTPANVSMVALPIMKDGDVDRARSAFREAVARAGKSNVLARFADFTATPYTDPYVRILSAELDMLLRDTTASEDLRYRCLACYWAQKAQLALSHDQLPAARAYYDSALAFYESTVAQIEERPTTEHYTWRLIGIYSARLGHKERAIEAAERALQLLPVAKDAYDGPHNLWALAEVYALAGEHEMAIETLEELLSIPSDLSVPILRLDPLWDPLRDDPRFQALLEKYDPPAR